MIVIGDYFDCGVYIEKAGGSQIVDNIYNIYI